MADKKKQVILRVEQDILEDWDNSVEDNPEYSDRSHLIRTAVHHEITDGWVLASQAEEFDVGDIDVDLDDVEQQLQSLNREVRELQDQLERQELSEEAAEDENIRSLAAAAQDYIPLVDSTEEVATKELADVGPNNELIHKESTPDDLAAGLPAEERAKITGSSDDIAQALSEELEEEVEKIEAEKALAYLENQLARVKYVSTEEGRRYCEVRQ